MDLIKYRSKIEVDSEVVRVLLLDSNYSFAHILVLGTRLGTIYVIGISEDGKNKIIKIYKEHQLIINYLKYFSENSFISGSQNDMRIWNIEKDTSIQYLKVNSPILCIEVLYQNTKLALGHHDNSLSIFDINKNNIETLNLNKNSVVCLCYLVENEDILLCASFSRINIINLKTKEVEKTYKEHSDNIRSLISINNRDLFVSASSDKTIKIFSTTQEKSIRTLDLCNLPIFSLGLLKSNILLVGSFDSKIILYDMENNKKLSELVSDEETFIYNFDIRNNEANSLLVSCDGNSKYAYLHY